MPNSPPLKVAVLGCGRIAQMFHLDILRRLADVEVVALADPLPANKIAALRFFPAARFYAHYQELLADQSVDAAVICLPNDCHAAAAIMALERGINVYVEKPLAINLAEGKQLLAAWRRSGKVGVCGFNFRFHRHYNQLKGYLERRQIGDLVGVRTVLSSPARELPLWKQKRVSGGSALLDLASHHVDLIYCLFQQDIQQIFAEIQSQVTEDDTAVIHYRLANNLLIQSFHAFNSVQEDRFEIYGRNGKLVLDRYRSHSVEATGDSISLPRVRTLGSAIIDLLQSQQLLGRFRESADRASFRLALTNFITAVRTQHQTTPSLRDGFRSLAAIVTAEAAMQRGQALVVDDFLRENAGGG